MVARLRDRQWGGASRVLATPVGACVRGTARAAVLSSGLQACVAAGKEGARVWAALEVRSGGREAPVPGAGSGDKS